MFNNREEIIFSELNDKLSELGQDLEIICAGGYVLDRFDIRSTQDIDAFFKTNIMLEEAIKDIGNKYQINPKDELWLNNSIQSMNNKPPVEICEKIYDFSNLHILSVPLKYVMCMKLRSGREQDIEDVSKIITKLEIPSPKEFSDILVEYKFTDIDESLILESFGKAYGMEWLEKYYIENIESLFSDDYIEKKNNTELDNDWDNENNDWND